MEEDGKVEGWNLSSYSNKNILTKHGYRHFKQPFDSEMRVRVFTTLERGVSLLYIPNYISNVTQ